MKYSLSKAQHKRPFSVLKYNLLEETVKLELEKMTLTRS